MRQLPDTGHPVSLPDALGVDRRRLRSQQALSWLRSLLTLSVFRCCSVCVSMFVPALVLVPCVAATLMAPPTPAELFVGVRASSTVPGLAYPMVPTGSRGHKPTIGTCAAAWNSSAPQRTLQWVIARSPHHGMVAIAKVPSQAIGVAGRRYVVSACVFAIAVSPRHILVASGPWRHTIPLHAWTGQLLTYKSRGTVTTLTRRFNATVSPNGMIELS